MELTTRIRAIETFRGQIDPCLMWVVMNNNFYSVAYRSLVGESG